MSETAHEVEERTGDKHAVSPEADPEYFWQGEGDSGEDKPAAQGGPVAESSEPLVEPAPAIEPEHLVDEPAPE